MKLSLFVEKQSSVSFLKNLFPTRVSQILDKPSLKNWNSPGETPDDYYWELKRIELFVLLTHKKVFSQEDTQIFFELLQRYPEIKSQVVDFYNHQLLKKVSGYINILISWFDPEGESSWDKALSILLERVLFSYVQGKTSFEDIMKIEIKNKDEASKKEYFLSKIEEIKQREYNYWEECYNEFIITLSSWK